MLKKDNAGNVRRVEEFKLARLEVEAFNKLVEDKMKFDEEV